MFFALCCSSFGVMAKGLEDQLILSPALFITNTLESEVRPPNAAQNEGVSEWFLLHS